MSKNKEYIKNTVLLFIGKFSTQFMSLILLPLFTHFLIKEDYGYIDLIQTYISLLFPILTLRIDSAAFRFLIEARKKENNQKEIISSLLVILLSAIIITLVIDIIVSFYININYNIYIVINIITIMISNLLLQILRGFGKNKHYSIASIITGVFNLATNIFLILVIKSGASSILISSIVSNIACALYTFFIAKIYKYINIKSVSKNEIKRILKYSIPMIPNHLSWWVVNVSDRTIISYFLGAALNGIYTVSCKFSNILNSVFSIFNMSWQESASLHIDDDDRDEFFTGIINKLLLLFCDLSILILAFIPIFYDILIGNAYIDSYKYIPILLYGNLWNILISLIGGIYVAKKKTQEIAKTTIISAIINLVIHILLIKYIGLYAACISTLISYIIMGIYRLIDCQKYVRIKLNYKKIIMFTFIYLLCTISYIINSIMINIITLLIVLLYLFISNYKIIKIILKKFLKGKCNEKI